MAELKFDHTKEDENFLEALGLSESDLKELNIKLTKMSQFIITKTPKKSELVEKIAQTFSYNELVLTTTFFIIDKTADILKQNPMMALLAALSQFKKDKE